MVGTAGPRPRDLAAWRDPQRAEMIEAAVTGLARTNPALSAQRRFSPDQANGLVFGALLLVAGAMIFPAVTAIAITAAFVAFGGAVLSLRAALLFQSLKPGPVANIAPPPNDLPMVTVFCPLYDEALSLPTLVASLDALDYPRDKLDLKLVLEEDDHATLQAAMVYRHRTEIDIVLVPPIGPRTKPKALNYALPSALGSLCVIYDAEDRPEPDQLRKAAVAFANGPSDLACLQARLNYYGRKRSLIARLFAVEYALLFDIFLPGLARLGLPLPLGGTSNIFRTRALVEVGGWDPFNVTEDADVGLRLAQRGYRCDVLNSTTFEDPVTTIRPWLRQRSRWIKGYLQTWIVHTRRVDGPRAWRHQLTLHLVVGGVLVSALLNPIFWGLYGIWLLSDGAWLDTLFPPPLGTLATAMLLVGGCFHLWLTMLAPLARSWHDLIPYALLAPFYWMLQSAAGVLAVWQFWRNPHHWEKTAHNAGFDHAAVMAEIRAETA